MKVSYIPLSKLGNIPIINFPKYPLSLEVNKNIPKITNAKYEYRMLGTFCKVHTSCNDLCSITLCESTYRSQINPYLLLSFLVKDEVLIDFIFPHTSSN